MPVLFSVVCIRSLDDIFTSVLVRVGMIASLKQIEEKVYLVRIILLRNFKIDLHFGIAYGNMKGSPEMGGYPRSDVALGLDVIKP